ncbi:FcoT family thioesterase [Streptomyces milbemycinicus]|uniref:(2E)-enoyl-[ACP] glycyltransferase n=1 Tax=Streptomyces milbemycinicus TaxID=476552 RepID=A0ABW8LPF0_9ACTN
MTAGPLARPTAGTATAHPDDPALRERVLRPYRTNCRYLGPAEIRLDNEAVTASGAFRIGESCYIDDTGHFNAVEFNICFNQIAYYLIAKCAQNRLPPVFAAWTLDDYWQRQLSDILITRFTSRFHRAIRGQEFRGELSFTDFKLRSGDNGRAPLALIESECRFWDEGGGRCTGEIQIALTNLPQGAPR